MFVGSRLVWPRKLPVVSCLGHRLAMARPDARKPCIGGARILRTQSHEQASDHPRTQNLLFKLFFYSVASHLILRSYFCLLHVKRKFSEWLHPRGKEFCLYTVDTILLN